MIYELKQFWTGSIHRQLMLGIALVHGILMTIFVADLVYRERQFLLDLSQNQATGLAHALAANGSSWILAHDFIGIEELIESQNEFPDLRYAMVTNLNGQVLGYSDRAQVGKYTQDEISLQLHSAEPTIQILIDEANFIDIASPVFSKGSHIGWARVGVSRLNILSNLQIVTRNGLIYTLLAIMVGILFAWVMARGLSSGILHISNLMNQVKGGNRKVDFTLDRKDELGQLSRDMTKTMSDLDVMEKELYKLYERTRVTLRSIGDGVITTHADGSVEYLNPVAEMLTGWSKEEAAGRPLLEIFPITNEITGEIAENPVEKALKNNAIIGLGNHAVLTNRTGQRIAIEDSAAPIHDDHDQIIGVVLVFHDATDETLLKRRMEHQATHDSLTGVWNRWAFEKELMALHKDSDQNQSTHALLYIDLDQFKVVNDTAGHGAGDELLHQLISQFSNIVKGPDMLARLGGDEFGVLLSHCDGLHAQKVAEEIRSDVERFDFFWNQSKHKVSASIGIAMITQLTSAEESLSHADLACYSAKDLGRNQVYMYAENDKKQSARHGEMYWVSVIHEALAEEKFVLFSQLIAPIKDRNVPEYREILVRMRDDKGEIIPPSAFIPAAERYDLMSKIDSFVINKAVDWLSQQKVGQYRLSINLSGNSLGNLPLLNYIEDKLRSIPEVAHSICFEVTETAAISYVQVAINFMNRLIKIGVQFSLDDFGSGLSSFSYLKAMPVTSLKIDGSFIKNIATDSVNAAMVQAISQVSRKLGIVTIAEFVEDQTTLDKLKTYRVDFAQGYHIEKPRPLSEL
jgi:diguanylate cyclase (GGDEF)-like protein/PAS domain S-box-containing protein